MTDFIKMTVTAGNAAAALVIDKHLKPAVLPPGMRWEGGIWRYDDCIPVGPLWVHVHVIIYGRDSNLDGVIDKDNETRVQAWIGNGILTKPQAAFPASFSVTVRDRVRARCKETLLYPGCVIADRDDAWYEGMGWSIPLKWLEWCVEGGPSIDNVPDIKLYYSSDLAHQHTTGLEDQYVARTPGELAVASGQPFPDAGVLESILLRVDSEGLDPVYFVEMERPDIPIQPGDVSVDLWESGLTSHRIKTAKTYGWDAVGGPRSPNQGYSVEHFGRAVNAAFDAAFGCCDLMAFWMVSAKMAAVTWSLGWEKQYGEDATEYPTSLRATAWVALAQLKMHLLTGAEVWRWAYVSALQRVFENSGWIQPDGIPPEAHPPVAYVPLSRPDHGHGNWSESNLRMWWSIRPDGPHREWLPEWSEIIANMGGEWFYANVLDSEARHAGVEDHGSQWYYMQSGLKGEPDSSSWHSGIAIYRVMASNTVWMFAYVCELLRRVADAGPVPDEMFQWAHMAGRFMAQAHEGVGLIPGSKSFHRDVQPRIAQAVDEHVPEPDLALARVSMEGCYALMGLVDGKLRDRLWGAARSVWFHTDRTHMDSPKCTYGKEFWYAWGVEQPK